MMTQKPSIKGTDSPQLRALLRLAAVLVDIAKGGQQSAQSTEKGGPS